MRLTTSHIIMILLLFGGASWTYTVYDVHLPEHFPTPSYEFANNLLDSQMVFLGRALFYDPILSRDSTISCASCHSPYNAFAHTDHALSHGINDKIGIRNAPPLFNLAWSSSFMWDGAINHLDVQALAPLTSETEMGESFENVIAKLQRSEKYRPLFQTMFRDSILTGEYFLKALSQFQLSLISANSKYDKVIKGDGEFTPQEQKGYAVFKAQCNTCHQEPLFSDFSFANNGLAIDTTLNDFGKGVITKLATDSLRFKVPSLKNLSYTYPYMHDGRFRKLHQVLEHYADRDNHNASVDQRISSSTPLTSIEKADLISFLLTLDDKEFVFDQKHQFPRWLLDK